MSETAQFTVQINAIGDNKVLASIESIRTAMGKITAPVRNINLSAVIQQVSAVGDGLKSLSAPGLELSTKMADLSAITGVTGKKLQEIEGYARDNAKAFGTSAADSVESFKLVLSQLTPEIAKQPQALKAMGENISILSKTMGGNTVAATEVLTTAMNQYGISMADPMEASREMSHMMNIMAAAAKEGSAELPQIKNALEQVGGVAKATGVSFSETNAAIQLLDKVGRKGAEGGVSLRNVLTTLSEGRFLPKEVRAEFAQLGIDVNALGDKSKTLTERMNILKPVVSDTALLTKLFGKENILAGQALITGTAEIDRFNAAIQGTRTAVEQAAIVMDSPAEKMKRWQAAIDDFKVSIFEVTGGLTGYLSVLGDLAKDVANLAPLYSGATKAVKWFTGLQKVQVFWTNILTAAQWLLNIALNANPISLIVLAIAALIGVVTAVVSCYDQWGAAATFLLGPLGIIINLVMTLKRNWDSITEAFSNGGIIAGIKRIGIVLFDVILYPLQKALEGLSYLTGKDSFAAEWAESIREKRESLGLANSEKKIEKPETASAENAKGIAPAAGSAGAKAHQSAEAIATGGKKSTTIQIQFKNMVEEIHIAGKDFKESVDDMEVQLREAFVRILAMAVSTAG